MRRLIRYLLIILALSSNTGATSAAASDLCIRSIPIRAPADAPAKAAGTIVSRPSQTIAPSAMDLPAGGKFPLVYDFFTEKLPDGEKRNRTFFWHPGPSDELLGPRDLDDHRVRSKVSFNSIGASAADPDGRILFLAGSYDKTGADQVWHQWIYAQDRDRPAAPLRPDLQERMGEPRSIFWSDLQNAFVIQGMSPDPKTGGLVYKTSLLTGTDVKVLDGYAATFAADLPTLGVTALLGFSRLAFVDRGGVPTLIGGAKSGPEGDNWAGIYETGDQGWLYVDGAEYDYAARVERVDGAWQLASLIRFVNEGVFDRDGDQARQKMEGLTDIVRTEPCRVFSTALRRMIVCSGQMQELRAGALVPIGGSQERLVQFVGDAPNLGLALFLGDDGRLYGYDGDRLILASGILRDRALVQSLPSSRRTFLSTRDSLFELRRDGAALRLDPLKVPPPGGDLLFTRFFELSGDVVALLREGAYAVDNLELRPVWVPDVPERIDTTSALLPIYVPALSGVLFASTLAVSGVPEFRVLAPCSGAN